MKHEKIFRKVRKLIDERELTDANLEMARDELFAIVENDSECDWAYGLLSEINYWLGEYATDAEDKLFFFDEGVQCGESGLSINEDSLESNFWLAVNSGSFGQEKGIMQSLAMISPIKNAAEKALKIDENYFLRRTLACAWQTLSQSSGLSVFDWQHQKSHRMLGESCQFGSQILS